MHPNLIKDHPELPDFYTVTLRYVSGRTSELKVIAQRLQAGQWEFLTHDNLWTCATQANVEQMSFDANYTKLRELMAAKENKNG